MKLLSLPGNPAPARTPPLGTRSRSSRTWGSSLWGSGSRGCRRLGETCTPCARRPSPRQCTRTGCSDQSPGNTILPRSKCCRCPRRWCPAAPPPRSPGGSARTGEASEPRPRTVCAQPKHMP